MFSAAKKPRRAQPGTAFIVSLSAIIFLTAASLAFSHIAPQARSLRTRDLRALEDESAQCRQVHAHVDQCAWVRKHCVDEDAGLISYLDLYYCKLPHLKPIGFTIIASWTALLFSTIGIAASDFFCVNLSTISNMLGISENMAGVTFLAFGNGSPDVFSTFAAIRSNSGSLAVGELIGAAGFITAVVSGSMALVRPFKVARKSFIRDVSFFAVSVAFSMIFCANGKLELWECAVMVAYYVFYVIIGVVWHGGLSQRRLRREKHVAARGDYLDSGPDTELEFEEESPRDEIDETTPLRPRVARHASLEDFVDLERANAEHDVLDSLDEGTRRQQWLGEINSSMRITQTPVAERRNVSGAIRPSLVGALEFQSTLNNIRRSRNIQSIPIHLRRYSDEPSYTLAQQQADNDDAVSFVSDPESPSASRELHQHPGRAKPSKTGHEDGVRARAKSAGAAALLTVPKKRTRQRKHATDDGVPAHLSSLNRPIDEAEELTDPARRLEVRAPTISINAPEEQDLASFPAGTAPGQPSAPSMEHLAPPDLVYGTTSDEPDGEDKPDHVERPRLRITTPNSVSTPQHQSPHLSPFPTLSDGSATPQSGSIVLGAPAMGLNEMTQSPVDMGSRPISWWPYSLVPPPQEIFQTLMPTLYLWKEKNIWGKLVAIAAAPSFFLLTITLPVVEPQANDDLIVGATPVTANSRALANGLSPSESMKMPERGRRGSTARVAIETERRHRHSSPVPPSSAVSTTGTSTDVAMPPEHPHSAVISPTSWNRWLVMIQCFTAPYIVFLTVWANFYDADVSMLLWPSLCCLVASFAALTIVLLTTTSSRPPQWHWLLCFVGFAVAITWISTIANEVVGVLKAIGVIFDISDAILGLTIFAVGNSLGDLVADITVARLGFPVMALSACFGGPMLNILLGIGLSGLYMTITGAEKRQHKHPEKGLHFKPYHVEVSTTLLISASALLVTLLGLLVAVPLNGWKMDRKIGIGLIILWVVSTAGNLGVEISGIGDLW